MKEDGAGPEGQSRPVRLELTSVLQVSFCAVFSVLGRRAPQAETQPSLGRGRSPRGPLPPRILAHKARFSAETRPRQGPLPASRQNADSGQVGLGASLGIPPFTSWTGGLPASTGALPKTRSTLPHNAAVLIWGLFFF